MCVLTGREDPEAAHIYPHSLIRSSTREPRAVARFWSLLNVFWEPERVESWKREIFGNSMNFDKPTHGCFNLISLQKDAHALWGAGRFALRPIEYSTDHKTLKIEFHWVRKPSHRLEEIDLLKIPETSRGVWEYRDGHGGLGFPTGTYMEDGRPVWDVVRSGDVFTMTTSDSDKLPLPSLPLLELQWNLQRIAGMSGAAEPQEEFSYDDDEEEERAMKVPDRDAPIRRVRTVFDWLGQLPADNELSPANVDRRLHITV